MTETYLGVRIDKDRDKLLSEQSEKLLTEYYCRGDETSPQMAFARAANAYSYGDKKLAQKIYDGASKGSEEHTSELQSRLHLVCRLLLEKKKKKDVTIVLLAVIK